MSELKKKINYTVACVNEFADRYQLSSKEAFEYPYYFRGTKPSIITPIISAYEGLQN